MDGEDIMVVTIQATVTAVMDMMAMAMVVTADMADTVGVTIGERNNAKLNQS